MGRRVVKGRANVLEFIEWAKGCGVEGEKDYRACFARPDRDRLWPQISELKFPQDPARYYGAEWPGWGAITGRSKKARKAVVKHDSAVALAVCGIAGIKTRAQYRTFVAGVKAGKARFPRNPEAGTGWTAWIQGAADDFPAPALPAELLAFAYLQKGQIQRDDCFEALRALSDRRSVSIEADAAKILAIVGESELGLRAVALYMIDRMRAA